MLFNRMAPRYDPFRQSLSKNGLEGNFGSFILGKSMDVFETPKDLAISSPANLTFSGFSIGVFFATIYFCYFAEPTIVYKISVERNPKTETRHTDNFTYTVIISAAILITVGYVLEVTGKL